MINFVSLLGNRFSNPAEFNKISWIIPKAYVGLVWFGLGVFRATERALNPGGGPPELFNQDVGLLFLIMYRILIYLRVLPDTKINKFLFWCFARHYHLVRGSE